MQTKIVPIENIQQQRGDLWQAGKILREGGLVAFPTETVYGLGANGLDAAACAKIYEAKGRPSDNPLILHVADRKMIDMVAREVPPMADKLIRAFCPGPLTLIMKRKSVVPDRITGGLDTVGIRMPESDIARAMIAAAGVPIAAPSANISGRPSPTTAKLVAHDMNGRIPLILDGGPCRYGVESTIVDCTGQVPVILRPGAITREMIEGVLGDVDLDPALVGEATIPKAPGMKYKHYAPKVPMTLIEGETKNKRDAFHRVAKTLQGEGKKVGIIASREIVEDLRGIVPDELMVNYGREGDLKAIAANLYEALCSFDDKDVDVLLGEGTTDKGLGLAIMNRLHKASGFHSIYA